MNNLNLVKLPEEDIYIRSGELASYIGTVCDNHTDYSKCQFESKLKHKLQRAYNNGLIKGVNVKGRNYYSLDSVATYLNVEYGFLFYVVSKGINEKASKFNRFDYKKFYILSEQDVLEETEGYKDRLDNVRKLSRFIVTEFADVLPVEAKAELLAIVNNERLSTADRNRLNSILEDYIYPMNSAK